MPHRDQQVFIGQRSYHQSPLPAGSRAGVILLALLLSLTLIIAGTVTAQQSSDLIPLPALPGEEVIRLGRGEAQAAMFSPNGSLLAVGTNLGLWLYNAADLAATPTLMIRDITITSVEFNPTSDRVVISRSNNTAEVYDVATGSLLLTLTGHTGVVNHASYSPDGTRIVTASDDNTARMWNAATGAIQGIMTDHTADVRTAYFSPDNSKIVSAGEDFARLFDASTSALLNTLVGHAPYSGAAFSPDGSKIISASEDDVRVWNTSTGVQLQLIDPPLNTIVEAARFSPNGSQIAIASDNALWLYNAADYTRTSHLEGRSTQAASLSYSPDGTRIAAIDTDGYSNGPRGVTVYTLPTTPDLGLTIPDVHTSNLHSLHYSPDGTRLVSSSLDQTVKIWDVATGALLQTITSPQYVEEAVFSPDGTRIAGAGSSPYAVYIWEVATGNLIHTLTGHTYYIDSVAWNPDGTRVISSSRDDTAKVWDAINGGTALLTLTGHTDDVNDVTYSPDGSQIATGADDNTVRLWDAATGTPLRTLTGHTDDVKNLSYHPSGTRLLSAGYDRVIIWDPAGGARLNEFDYNLYNAAYSPDGTRIIGYNYRQSLVLDALNGQEIKTVYEAGDVYGVAINPAGTRIASIANSSAEGRTIKIWDITVGLDITRLDWHPNDYNAVTFSADGTRAAAAANDGRVRVWNQATGALLLSVSGNPEAANDVAFSPDGSRLAVASAAAYVYVFDSVNGELLTTLSGHTDAVNSVAFSADGTKLVTGSEDKTARIWDSTTGAVLKVLGGHTDYVSDAAFSPDGLTVATASDDNTLRTWDALTGSPVATLAGHASDVNSVVFNADGTRILSGADDNLAKVWLTAGGSELLSINVGHDVEHAAFNPDGTRIVTGTSYSTATLKVWNAATGVLERTLTGHTAYINDVAFHPGGSQLASASDDGTVRIWEVGIIDLPTAVPTSAATEAATDSATLAPTDAATDSATPTATEPVGTNVIVNGGFEDSTAVGAPWVLKNGTKDKIKANTPDKVIAHSGTNAFQFKGGGSENSRLQQKVDLTAHNFSENHVLDLSLWSRASKSGVEATVKFQVTYDDGTEPDKTTLKVGTSTTWTESMGSITLASEDVLKIQVQIKFTASSGKVYIDDVTLVHTPTGSRFGEIILPLP